MFVQCVQFLQIQETFSNKVFSSTSWIKKTIHQQRVFKNHDIFLIMNFLKFFNNFQILEHFQICEHYFQIREGRAKSQKRQMAASDAPIQE